LTRPPFNSKPNSIELSVGRGATILLLNKYENITTTTGANYGVNIHRAGVNSENIENWSAGCQVFKKEADIKDFLNLCDVQKGLYGNKFTYTLITTLDIVP
jgi:hypothetical protein